MEIKNSKFKIRNFRNGFSLMELVVYIAILAALSVFTINAIVAISSAYEKAKVTRQILFESDAALERIIRETRLASGVDVLASSFGLNPSRIQLSSIVSAQDTTPITKQIYVNNGQLFLQEGSNPAVALTSEKINIKSFTAFFISTAVSEAIRYDLLVSGGGGKASSSAEFFSTAVLRRSY